MSEEQTETIKTRTSSKLALRRVPFSKIIFGERFRKDYTGVDDLGISIRDKGNLQPMIVDKDLNLIAGGRRYRAFEYLRHEDGDSSWDEVDVVVREVEDELDARECELIENLMRKNLTWHENGELVKRLHLLYLEKNKDWSQQRTAELLERSIGGISEQLQLADAVEKLPELKKIKTVDEAKKVLSKVQEALAMKELRRRRDTGETKKKDQKLEAILKRAEEKYNVGDVFEGLARLKDHDYELSFIEVDPPYAIDFAKQKRSVEGEKDRTESYVEIDQDKYDGFLVKLCKELARVSSSSATIIFWFGPQWYPNVFKALTDSGFDIDPIPGIWTKGHGQTNQPYKRLARTYECFLYGAKSDMTKPILKAGHSNIFEFRGTEVSNKYHPTQRPLDLMKELIEVFGARLPTEKHRILVPFLGSGATIIAADQLSYNAFGWDINPEYKDKYLFEVRRLYAKRFALE